MSETRTLAGNALGDTQLRLLEALKREGELTLKEAQNRLQLSSGTLREHVNALGARGLVTRSGTRQQGRGRPEAIYTLSDEGHAIFPQRASQILSELLRYLIEGGHEHLVRGFLERHLENRLEASKSRVAKLRGAERLSEVAKIMSEEGFMAEARTHTLRRNELRLCHCPWKEIVANTQLPCRLEEAFVESLVERPLLRTSFIPDGDASCSYLVDGR